MTSRCAHTNPKRNSDSHIWSADSGGHSSVPSRHVGGGEKAQPQQQSYSGECDAAEAAYSLHTQGANAGEARLCSQQQRIGWRAGEPSRSSGVTGEPSRRCGVAGEPSRRKNASELSRGGVIADEPSRRGGIAGKPPRSQIAGQPSRRVFRIAGESSWDERRRECSANSAHDHHCHRNWQQQQQQQEADRQR